MTMRLGTGLLLAFASAALLACDGENPSDLTAAPVGGGGSEQDASFDAAAGSGGSSGAAGHAGNAGGSAGAAGTGPGGQGGDAGSAGSSPECSGGCDDGIDCTIDSCVADSCRHAPGSCQAGHVCDLQSGCVQAPVCSSDEACKQRWGDDPCKANIHCDGVTATCAYSLLDKDDDGHAPIVCGGDDCDDIDPARYGGLPEVCDGKDNDCDGVVDEQATCPGLEVCAAGECVCPAEYVCGSDCADRRTDPNHCGTCFNKCPTLAQCVSSTCTCPNNAPSVCGSSCVNTDTDALHCGGCNHECAPGYVCNNGQCTCPTTSCGGVCVDTQNDAQHCGGCNKPCPPGAVCQSGTCVCPPTAPVLCDNHCVNTMTDPDHCGACNHACYGECTAGQCPACVPGGLLILLDVSGSMTTPVNGSPSRTVAAIEAIRDFLVEPASAGLAVGFQHYPHMNGGTASCTLSDYATPRIGIADLPANSTAIINVMSTLSINGTSVFSAALGGGIEAVRAWQGSAPSRPGAVVMINDGGLGIGCSSETANQATLIAQDGYSYDPQVRTYIIGMGPPDTTTTALWSDVATAGGGQIHSTGNDGKAAVLQALRTIRDQYTCRRRFLHANLRAWTPRPPRFMTAR